LNSDDIKEFHKKVAEVNADTKNYKLNNIEISAYASPDGGVKLNTGLAENREANTEKYMERQLKKARLILTWMQNTLHKMGRLPRTGIQIKLAG